LQCEFHLNLLGYHKFDEARGIDKKKTSVFLCKFLPTLTEKGHESNSFQQATYPESNFWSVTSFIKEKTLKSMESVTGWLFLSFLTS